MTAHDAHENQASKSTRCQDLGSQDPQRQGMRRSRDWDEDEMKEQPSSSNQTPQYSGGVKRSLHAGEEGVPDKKHKIDQVVLDLSQASHAEGRRHVCEKNKILIKHSGPIRSCDQLRRIKEICQIQEANGGYFAFTINKSNTNKVVHKYEESAC